MHIPTYLITRALPFRNYRSQSCNNEFKALLITEFEVFATVSRVKRYRGDCSGAGQDKDGWKHGGVDKVDGRNLIFDCI